MISFSDKVWCSHLYEPHEEGGFHINQCELQAEYLVMKAFQVKLLFWSYFSFSQITNQLYDI